MSFRPAIADMLDRAGSGRNATLEFLRLFLAVAVMFFHYFYFGPGSGSVPAELKSSAFVGYGTVAVTVFFVISGFLIARSAEGRSWSSFLASRVARLLPAMMACGTITALLLGWAFGYGTVFPLHLHALTLLPVMWAQYYIDGSYWSIAYELRFYLLVVLLVMGARLGWLAEILTLAGLAGLAIDFAEVAASHSGVILYPYIAYFALGVLLYRFVSAGVTASGVVLMAVNVGIAARATQLQLLDIAGIGGLPTDIVTCLGVVVLSLAIFGSAYLLGAKVPFTPIAGLAGGLSYPLYLIHQRFGYEVINLSSRLVPVEVAAILAIVASMAIALLVHLGVERPFGPVLRRAIGRALAPLDSASPMRKEVGA